MVQQGRERILSTDLKAQYSHEVASVDNSVSTWMKLIWPVPKFYGV